MELFALSSILKCYEVFFLSTDCLIKESTSHKIACCRYVFFFCIEIKLNLYCYSIDNQCLVFNTTFSSSAQTRSFVITVWKRQPHSMLCRFTIIPQHQTHYFSDLTCIDYSQAKTFNSCICYFRNRSRFCFTFL